jgi:hypothetical protein
MLSNNWSLSKRCTSTRFRSIIGGNFCMSTRQTICFFLQTDESSIAVCEIDDEELKLKEELRLSELFLSKLNKNEVSFLEGYHFAHWNPRENLLTVNNLRNNTSKIIELPVKIESSSVFQSVRLKSQQRECLHR